MQNRLEKRVTIPISFCDHTAQISISGMVSLFMDMATEHGSMMGLGMKELSEKGLIWLAIRTKIRIFSRPQLMDTITLSTWPEKPAKIRCHRYYAAYGADGTLMLDGKNEWVMMDTAAGRPCRLAAAYPVDMEHCADVVCEEPFFAMKEDFSDCEPISEYVVRATDIDVSRHMNNVAYIRAALGLFNCQELEEMKLREIEALYRVQCYEGEVLSLRMRKDHAAYEIGIVKPDGKTACVVRLARE